MEHLVLKVLSFDVAVPTTNWFCDAYLKSFEASDVIKSLTMYLAELTLVDSETYMKYLPSQIAASAVCLARLSMGEEPWSKELVKKAKYEISEFSDCMTDLHKTYLSASKMQQQAIPEKYKSSKHQEVSNSSLFPPLETLELR